MICRTSVDSVVPGYIARMKKEKEERLAHETYQSNGYTSYVGSGNGPPGNHSTVHHPMPGSKRGGYAYGGSGYNSYHPYQRSQPTHIPQKFKNRSVTFTRPDSSIEPSRANEAANRSPKAANNTLPRQSSQQQIDSKTLCPALTSTGIFDAITMALSFPSRVHV